MPLTPLHTAFAYLAKKSVMKLSLPALIVSSMLPDLEIPLIYLTTTSQSNRLFLHSLFGAATLGTLLSVLLTVFVYPAVISIAFRLERRVVEEACRFSSSLVISCFLGCLSHVLIDALHHEFNPVLYPFVEVSFDSLVLFGNQDLASSVVHFAFAGIVMLVLGWELTKGIHGFWERVLVG